MSKFSKILAVVMSVCLLFGATTAFLASADDQASVLAVGDKSKVAVDATKTNPTGSNSNFVVHTSHDAGYDLKDYAYLTIDFDFVSNNDSLPLLKFTPSIFSSDDNITAFGKQTSSLGKSLGGFSLVKSSDLFYVYKEGENTLLSNEVGKYDHFTIAYKIENTDAGLVVTPTLYVNGKYVNTFPSITLTATYNTFYRINIGNLKGTEGSVTLTNYIANYYAAGSSKTASLEEILNSKLPLYSFDGNTVVYNKYYDTHNDYVMVDEKKVSIPAVVPELLATVKNGSEIEAKIDVTNFDVPDGVEHFTVKYDPEKTVFTLADEDAENYFFLPNSDGTFTVRVANENDKVVLKRMVKLGEDTILVESKEFIYLVQPKSNVSFTALDLKTLKLYEGSATEWTMDVDGKVPESINLYGDEAIRELTELEAALVKEEFDGILTAYAEIDETCIKEDFSTGYAYIAGYEINGVFTPILDSEGGYDNYKSIDTLEGEMAYWDTLDEEIIYYTIENGVAIPNTPTVANAAPSWNNSDLQLQNAANQTASAKVTEIVKSTFKDNGAVDGYGTLIIR